MNNFFFLFSLIIAFMIMNTRMALLQSIDKLKANFTKEFHFSCDDFS